jgi:predicted PurR-regulated permease PerM
MKSIELNQGIKQVGFVVILLFIFCIIIAELNYFINSILGAFTLYMLLRKPLHRLEAKGWKTTLATFFLLIITILIVFVIGGLLVGTIYGKLKDFHPQLILDIIHQIRETVLEKTGYNILSKDVTDKAILTVSQMLPNIFSVTGSIITNAMMMVFVLFFMLQQSRKMEESIESNLPLSRNSIALLRYETRNMVVSNAIGIPIIMMGHALVSAFGYWIFEGGDPFVWGILTGLCGLIPVVGTAVIWLPLSINLFITGDIWQGIFLLAYGSVVISGVDNVIRMFFMKKYADVHPLITIFGIILGMNLFGFWGIIFGPLIISGFLVLLKIYKTEYLGNYSDNT